MSKVQYINIRTICILDWLLNLPHHAASLRYIIPILITRFLVWILIDLREINCINYIHWLFSFLITKLFFISRGFLLLFSFLSFFWRCVFILSIGFVMWMMMIIKLLFLIFIYFLTLFKCLQFQLVSFCHFKMSVFE